MKHLTLDEARAALFAASRELQHAHAERMRGPKTNWPAINRCRAADRDLQRKALEFAAAFMHEVREAPMAEKCYLLEAAQDPSLVYTSAPGSEPPTGPPVAHNPVFDIGLLGPWKDKP